MTIELKPITLCIWLCKDTAISLTRSLRHNGRTNFFMSLVCAVQRQSDLQKTFPLSLANTYTVRLPNSPVGSFCLMKFYIFKYIIKTKCTKGCSKDIFYCGIFRSNWWNDCFLSLFPSSFLYNVTEESSPKTGWRAVPCHSLKIHIISTLVPSC